MTRKLLFSFLLITAIFLMGCEKQTHTVRYEIEGNIPEIGVSYRNGLSGSESADVQSGWSQEFIVESYYRVSLRANTKNNEGDVTCRIFVDGELVSEATATGKFKNAICSQMPAPTPDEDKVSLDS